MKKLFTILLLFFTTTVVFSQTLHIFDSQNNQKKHVLEITDNVVGFIVNKPYSYIDCNGMSQESLAQHRYSFLSTTKNNGLLQINKESHYQTQCGDKTDFFINIHTQFFSFKEIKGIDFDENFYLLIEQK